MRRFEVRSISVTGIHNDYWFISCQRNGATGTFVDALTISHLGVDLVSAWVTIARTKHLPLENGVRRARYLKIFDVRSRTVAITKGVGYDINGEITISGDLHDVTFIYPEPDSFAEHELEFICSDPAKWEHPGHLWTRIAVEPEVFIDRFYIGVESKGLADRSP